MEFVADNAQDYTKWSCYSFGSIKQMVTPFYQQICILMNNIRIGVWYYTKTTLDGVALPMGRCNKSWEHVIIDSTIVASMI